MRFRQKLGKQSNINVDSYIFDTFDAFCNKIKFITVEYKIIQEQYHVNADAIFYDAEDQEFSIFDRTNANLFKPSVFDLNF